MSIYQRIAFVQSLKTNLDTSKTPWTFDYYDVDLPAEVSSDPDERANLAFLEAESRARLYVIPCEWSVVYDLGFMVRVRRIRPRVCKKIKKG